MCRRPPHLGQRRISTPRTRLSSSDQGTRFLRVQSSAPSSQDAFSLAAGARSTTSSRSGLAWTHADELLSNQLSWHRPRSLRLSGTALERTLADQERGTTVTPYSGAQDCPMPSPPSRLGALWTDVTRRPGPGRPAQARAASRRRNRGRGTSAQLPRSRPAARGYCVRARFR